NCFDAESEEPGIWYTYTPVSTGNLRVVVCVDSAQTWEFRAYSGTCDSLFCEEGEDDDCLTGGIVNMPVTAGTQYFFLVNADGDNPFGQFDDFDFTVTEVEAPENDFCDDAIMIELGEMVSGNTENASSENDIVYAGSDCSTPNDNGGNDDQGVWYSFVAPAEPVTFIAMGFDSLELAVHAGTCDSLDCIADVNDMGDEEVGGDGIAIISDLQLEEGETYLVFVEGRDGLSGMFMIEACFSGLVCTDTTVALDESGVATIDPSFVTVSNCDPGELTLSQTNFDCDDLGVVEVTVTGDSVFQAVDVATEMGGFLGSSVSFTIDGSGLSAETGPSAVHDPTEPDNSWASDPEVLTGDVVFELGSTQSINGLLFWNQNDGGPGSMGITGLNEVSFESSTDGINFSPIPGAPTSFAVEMGDFSSAQEFSFPTVDASFIRLNIISNHGDSTFSGFAEIAFTTATACTVDVFVEDNLGPVVLCQNDTVYLDESGNGSTSLEEVLVPGLTPGLIDFDGMSAPGSFSAQNLPTNDYSNGDVDFENDQWEVLNSNSFGPPSGLSDPNKWAWNAGNGSTSAAMNFISPASNVSFLVAAGQEVDFDFTAEAFDEMNNSLEIVTVAMVPTSAVTVSFSVDGISRIELLAESNGGGNAGCIDDVAYSLGEPNPSDNCEIEFIELSQTDFD
ncbi:MAG: discoidin domain-containing protein, partial [Bacteroidota bacterium]